MTSVVIGKSGQLANEIRNVSGDSTVLLGASDINLFDKYALYEKLTSYQPSAIINAAAYTAVDKAETETEAAYALNAQAVENLSNYCKDNACFFVHVSTDYVFDGVKGTPYLPCDELAPQSTYGTSKAKGEHNVRQILGNESTIIRTSWVYSSFGNNFVKTMLRLMREKDSLNVVDDQIGSPTWAHGLASACIEAAERKHRGTFHWTDEGVLSWYDFAVAIQQLGLDKGLLSKQIDIAPIPSKNYPTPATRPHYSVLDKTATRATFSTPLIHWYSQLSGMMDELVEKNIIE